MSLFIIVPLFHLWSYLQSQLRLPAFARTMASYINILLTRTVNCLLTKQKSYWQQPQRGRGCVCVCWESVSLWESEREKERGGGWWGERGWQREPLNVRPLLVWTPTGLSAGTHLSNALNAAPTLDCTISLSATKYRARGIRRSLSVILLSCLYFILLHILRCRTPPALLQQSVSAILPPLLYVRLHTS